MSTPNGLDVPQWVRTLTCVVGCLSVPALVIAACFGAEITPYLAVPVGWNAIRTAKFAFQNWHDKEPSEPYLTSSDQMMGPRRIVVALIKGRWLR